MTFIDSTARRAEERMPAAATTAEEPTAEQLRMRRAAKLTPIYHLGYLGGIHPSRISAYLRGTLPMPPGVAARIAAALDSE
jgi:hypothetical protein